MSQNYIVIFRPIRLNNNAKFLLSKYGGLNVFFNADFECAARFFLAPSVRKIFHILIFTYVDFVLFIRMP
jgi:hypothetical protein